MKKCGKSSNIISLVAIILLMIALVIGLVAFKRNKDELTADTIKQVNDKNNYTFLVVGRDRAAGLCDVIILANINTDNGDVSIMQIPRDTYFDCGNENHKKINSSYNSLGSMSSVSNALSSALGIKIDYYLSLDLDTVAKIVDAVGKIEIDVPMDMDYTDPEQNLSINLKAGKQKMDGKSAVNFLRYRSGYITGDLGRVDAQKLFLSAFIKRVGEIGNPFELYNVFKLISSNSENNIKEKNLLSIGFKCLKIKGGTVSYMTAPGEAIQSEKSGAWYYILSSKSMSELLKTRFDTVDTFDKNNKFVDKNVQSFFDIYNKDCGIRIYTTDDIENNKININ